MKTGKSLVDLARALEHNRTTAKDFIVPAAQLEPAVVGDNVVLAFGSNGDRKEVGLNSWSHSQLATYTDIPKAYYDRLNAQNPKLLADNITNGLQLQNGDKRMVRMLDGKVRALVSPRYRRLDSADLADAVMPYMVDAGMQVVSSDLTDRRFYLRAVTDRIQGEVAKGDVVQMGIMVTNSDVGAGSLRVEPFYLRLACLNGMVREHAIRKAHLGRALAVDDSTLELLSSETVRMGEAAFFAEVRDVVKGLLTPEFFERDLAKLREATQAKITNFDLQEVVDVTCRTLGLAGITQGVKTSIVEALASGNQGAGLTKWGLANSFTAVAGSDDVDFDQAVELERAGSAVIALQSGQWRHVAERRA